MLGSVIPETMTVSTGIGSWMLIPRKEVYGPDGEVNGEIYTVHQKSPGGLPSRDGCSTGIITGDIKQASCKHDLIIRGIYVNAH